MARGLLWRWRDRRGRLSGSPQYPACTPYTQRKRCRYNPSPNHHLSPTPLPLIPLPASIRLLKTISAQQNFSGHTLRTRLVPRRMFKKSVQQGRSERRGEAYASVR